MPVLNYYLLIDCCILKPHIIVFQHDLALSCISDLIANLTTILLLSQVGSAGQLGMCMAIASLSHAPALTCSVYVVNVFFFLPPLAIIVCVVSVVCWPGSET